MLSCCKKIAIENISAQCFSQRAAEVEGDGQAEEGGDLDESISIVRYSENLLQTLAITGW